MTLTVSYGCSTVLKKKSPKASQVDTHKWTHAKSTVPFKTGQTAQLSFTGIPAFFGKGSYYEMVSLDSKVYVICRISTTKDFTMMPDGFNFVFCISLATHSDSRLATVCYTSQLIRKPVIFIFIVLETQCCSSYLSTDP